MTDRERRRRIEEVCDAALSRDARERTAFVAAECSGDEALRQEVEALLAHAQTAEGFLGEPMGAIAADVLGAAPGASLLGRSIGPYQIASLLGAGGMGVIYRAVDTKLNRPVAIKVLADDLADTAARRRFQREAQTASSLNHPHIVTVHDVGDFEGRQYVVSELVDGGTLEQWARTTRPTWRQAVDLLVGVADGIAAAHAAGIVHRDIKPANVLVAKNGYAKLADFGLATLTERAGGAAGAVTETRTRPGTILGTIPYMSPEQASGRPVDARSDIFSFGVMLYELLTGRRPFDGASEVELVHGILHNAPPPIGGRIPQALRMVVEKSLEKDPAERYQSMRDLVVDLRRLARQVVEPPTLAAGPWRVGLGVIAAALVITAGGLAAWRTRVPRDLSGTQPIRSIAVLPLRNLSRDADQEFFSDGVTESLISSLAQVHALRVTSRTSVMRFKGTTKPIPEIGRELGVDGIIEGSVQRVGSRVRITAQLIRTSTDTHLWAHEYDRDTADLFKLQTEVTGAIAKEIRVEIMPDETTGLAGTRAVAPAAQELYALGRYHYWKNTRADRTQAVDYFRRAIQLQPDYAAAYAGIALASSGLQNSAGEWSAESTALKAVALDSNLAEAHAALASVRFDQWEWAAADQEYQRALDANPNSLDACACYPILLAIIGNFPKALAIIERAAATDPQSSVVQNAYGAVLYLAQRFEDAVRHLRDALALEPQNLGAYRLLVLAYGKIGKIQDAQAVVDLPELQADTRSHTYTSGLVSAWRGRRAEALKAAEILSQPPNPDRRGVALIYFALGNRDQGFEWLTKAVDAREPFVWDMKVEPLLDSVRSDPRYQTLLARFKLPE